MHNSTENAKQEFSLVYTDGSCHTRLRLGAWVAILFIEGAKIILSGVEKDTTHQRMELLAVLHALDFLKKEYPDHVAVKIISDSQYVTGLPVRRDLLRTQNFLSRKGTPVRNADLVKKIFQYEAQTAITFEKIKAHQRSSGIAVNYNAEADVLCRKRMREAVTETGPDQ